MTKYRYEVNASDQESRNEQHHVQNLYLEDGVNPLYESDLEMVCIQNGNIQKDTWEIV